MSDKFKPGQKVRYVSPEPFSDGTVIPGDIGVYIGPAEEERAKVEMMGMILTKIGKFPKPGQPAHRAYECLMTSIWVDHGEAGKKLGTEDDWEPVDDDEASFDNSTGKDAGDELVKFLGFDYRAPVREKEAA